MNSCYYRQLQQSFGRVITRRYSYFIHFALKLLCKSTYSGSMHYGIAGSTFCELETLLTNALCRNQVPSSKSCACTMHVLPGNMQVVACIKTHVFIIKYYACFMQHAWISDVYQECYMHVSCNMHVWSMY